MLRITDAQRTNIVSVPTEVAQHIGVFKDMIDTVPTPEGDSEPVVLDEKPETFDTFVLWLHHSPDFEVTKDNVEELLKLSHKYEIPALAKDVTLYLNSESRLIDAEWEYVLGASFNVTALEDKNRAHVVSNFRDFLTHPDGKKYFNMLMAWMPEKLYQLVRDAVVGELGDFPVNSSLKHITLRVVNLTSEEEPRFLYFRAKRTKALDKLTRNFCKIVDLQVQQVAFFYCEKRSDKTDFIQQFKGTQTAEELKMNNGDTIIAIRKKGLRN